MKHLLLCIVLVACSTQVTPDIKYNMDGHELIQHDYPLADVSPWPATIEFCERHVKAAKTKPEYLVDICVIACIQDPTKSWCPDLRELDDAGRYTPGTN